MTVSEATATGDVALLRALLEAGGDPNEAETEEHWPPLLEAAAADHVEAARLLLDAGADMYAPHRVERHRSSWRFRGEVWVCFVYY